MPDVEALALGEFLDQILEYCERLIAPERSSPEIREVIVGQYRVVTDGGLTQSKSQRCSEDHAGFRMMCGDCVSPTRPEVSRVQFIRRDALWPQRGQQERSGRSSTP